MTEDVVKVRLLLFFFFQYSQSKHPISFKVFDLSDKVNANQQDQNRPRTATVLGHFFCLPSLWTKTFFLTFFSKSEPSEKWRQKLENDGDVDVQSAPVEILSWHRHPNKEASFMVFICISDLFQFYEHFTIVNIWIIKNNNNIWNRATEVLSEQNLLSEHEEGAQKSAQAKISVGDKDHHDTLWPLPLHTIIINNLNNVNLQTCPRAPVVSECIQGKTRSW